MPFLCLFKHWCTTDKKVEADTIIAYVILTVFKVIEKLISQTLVFKEKPIQNMIFGHQIPKGYEWKKNSESSNLIQNLHTK